mmetsp:Transcript_42567/g.76913  ORF Transcript_42567/g.76913 Transcript_42567/m.76913 type:complete len:268 (-) Transcript_42567:430-1233(-)
MLELSLSQPANVDGQRHPKWIEALLLTCHALKRWGHRQERHCLAHRVAHLLCACATGHLTTTGRAQTGARRSRPQARRETSSLALLASCVEPREAVATQGGLRDSTAKGKHSQATVLQLLQLHLLCLQLVLGQEVLAELVVACILKTQTGRFVGNVAELGEGSQHLDEAAHVEHLEERAHLVLRPNEVGRTGKERLEIMDCASVVCINHVGSFKAEVGPWESRELGRHQTNEGQHGNAAVLQLSLTEVWEVLLALDRQTQGVEVEFG